MRETLLDEIRAKCPPDLIKAREHVAIAALVSEGRTEPSGAQVGKGTILETLGLNAGNAFLDVIDSQLDFRHVRHLVENGWLVASSPLVIGVIESLVGTVLTRANADKLLALGVRPAPVDVTEVIRAMEGL